MYALEREPESGSRKRVLTAAGILGLLLQGSLLGATAFIEQRLPSAPPERIQVRLSTPPELPTEPPERAPVEPMPKPQKVESSKKPPALRERSTPRPQPQQHQTPVEASPVAEAPSSEPAPLVVGLTLSSTSRGGRGPRFAVGNTLLGTPDKVAEAPAAKKTSQRVVREVPPAPTTPPTRRLVSRSGQAAKLKRGARPEYPSQAKQNGVEGVVVLSITINSRGQVESAHVLKGLGHGLDQSALSAARRTLWSPATVDGRPVPSTRRFNVRFTLQG